VTTPPPAIPLASLGSLGLRRDGASCFYPDRGKDHAAHTSYNGAARSYLLPESGGAGAGIDLAGAWPA
jgi:hypothetical protein